MSDQLSLLPDDPCTGSELLLPEETRRQRYPLTTFARDQERLEGIIEELGRGRPKAWICRTYKVGHDTLLRIEEANGPKIGELKKRLAHKLLFTCDLIVDQVQDAAVRGKLDVDKAAVTFGIFAEKSLLLSGDPTVIHANQDDRKRFTVDELLKRLRPLKNVTGTGLVDGGSQQTREFGAAGDAPALGT